MLQFLKYVLATIVGMLLCWLVVILFFAFVVGSAFKKEVSPVESGSILRIQLSQPISERTDDNPFKNISLNNFRAKQQPGLSDIVKDIKNAAADEKIKGIFLDVDDVSGGYASIDK